MASSNRHWPSMFKSKPSINQAWSHSHQNPSSLLSSCSRSSSNPSFSSGCEERTLEPKPRWNPKPEQIRILEAIFNSGMVNPPRDEIRRIRAQLQEYGQVGDANVFYWFQNRKSRSKHKQRTLQAKTAAAGHHSPPQPLPTSSSSSSSDKNSPKKIRSSSCGGGSSSNNSNSTCGYNMVFGDQYLGNSPTSVNQCNNYFQQLVTPHHTSASHDFVPHEPVFFPLQQSGASEMAGFSQGFCFDNPPTADHAVGGFSTLLFGDMLNGGGGDNQSSKRDDLEKFKFQSELCFLVSNPLNTSCAVSTPSPVVSTPNSCAISSSLGQILGVGEAGGMAGKSTVLINGVTIDVPNGPFNVKEEFGENVILVNSSTGNPILTNECGVTLDPLQNGDSYLLMSSLAASPLIDKLDSNPDLLASEFTYQII